MARAFNEPGTHAMPKKIFAVAMFLLFTACGGAVDSLDEGADDVSAASWQLFTVRRDERKCMAPMCGGWFATSAQNSSYVTDLDFSKSALDAGTQEMVRSAPTEELVLRAKL